MPCQHSVGIQTTLSWFTMVVSSRQPKATGHMPGLKFRCLPWHSITSVRILKYFLRVSSFCSKLLHAHHHDPDPSPVTPDLPSNSRVATWWGRWMPLQDRIGAQAVQLRKDMNPLPACAPSMMLQLGSSPPRWKDRRLQLC